VVWNGPMGVFEIVPSRRGLMRGDGCRRHRRRPPSLAVAIVWPPFNQAGVAERITQFQRVVGHFGVAEGREVARGDSLTDKPAAGA